MKIYIDEMPKACKDCLNCKRNNFDIYCSIRGIVISNRNVGNKRLPSCPLHPVAERETEVRKEVVEEISKNVAVETINGKRYARFKDLERILDQVERREK